MSYTEEPFEHSRMKPYGRVALWKKNVAAGSFETADRATLEMRDGPRFEFKLPKEREHLDRMIRALDIAVTHGARLKTEQVRKVLGINT